jgi:hypothetical protein
MRALLCLLAATTLLRADTLSELKAALKKLPAREPVRVKVVQKGWEEEGGKREALDETFTVADGPGGVHVDGKKARNSRKGLQAGENGGSGYVRPQEELLDALAEARLLEEKADTYEGKPVRRLRLALDADLDADTKAHLKRAVAEGTVWVGPDGLPVAWQRNLELKMRMMLVFSMDLKLEVRRRFLRHRDRLLVASESADVKGQAMGRAFAAESRAEGRVEP